jgi:predicted HAD superfamily Cof-like phosphohydrolase
MISYYGAVRAWHIKAGIPLAERPKLLTPERLALRLRLMREERRELDEALEAGDLIAAAKEAADEIVTVLGTMAEMGIPFDQVWAEIHRSNMAKIGPDGVVRMRPDGKILKPEGWRVPDIAAVLAAANPIVCYRLDPDNVTCEPDSCECVGRPMP